MVNDLIAYMTEKANRLAQNDPNRKKLAELRQKMSEKCIYALIKVWNNKNAVDQEANMTKNKQKIFPLRTIAHEISEDTESKLKNCQFMKSKDFHISKKALLSLLHGFKVSSESSTSPKKPSCQIL